MSETINEDNAPEIIEPVERAETKRGRGRPPKAATEERTPPSANTHGSGEAPKKRAKGKATGAEVEKFAGFLAMAHMAVASTLKADELLLTEPEAKSLAAALMGLAEQYEYTVNPKLAAAGALAATAFAIYAPRLAVIGQRVQAEAAARKRHTTKPAQGQPGQQAQPGAQPAWTPQPQEAAAFTAPRSETTVGAD